MKNSNYKKKRIQNSKGHLSTNETVKKQTLFKNKTNKVIKSFDRKTPKWFSIIPILIPILFFILLELALSIFNYGYNTHQWVDAGNGKYILNPEISKKYFNNVRLAPKTSEDVFDQQKKNNAFRIFVLGGSSAEGYPYSPMGSFSKYIRKRLELIYPNTIAEVVNISMTGVNSYTLLDLIPGVLDQNPDLILIYAGHNEFYGALGVGSTQSPGNSRNLVKLVLYLNKFKTTQLIRNSVNLFLSLFASADKGDTPGTLMSRMAKDQYITFNSEKYNEGIEQFAENLTDILSFSKDKNVPVILGTLASNLKDQKPFISTNTSNYKTAIQVYEDAQLELKNNKFRKANSLFRLAKDLDALRFRAPEQMNKTINRLGKEFNAKIVDIDSLFDSVSPDGIVGNNLMVDHLHPNLKGYQLMGNAYYEAMEKSGYLPKTKQQQIPLDKQDSLTVANFKFTDLDSTIGNNIITLLKNDWPYLEKGRNKPAVNLFNPKNFIDSIALQYIEKKISWIDAHINSATEYLKRDDVINYIKHMEILIFQYPVLTDINTAIKYFYEKNKLDPGDYTVKRVGIISLYSKNYDDAVKYLNISLQSDSEDLQGLYCLALAYSHKRDFSAALNTINKCLSINPKYPQANNLKNQLIDAIDKQSEN